MSGLSRKSTSASDLRGAARYDPSKTRPSSTTPGPPSPLPPSSIPRPASLNRKALTPNRHTPSRSDANSSLETTGIGLGGTLGFGGVLSRKRPSPPPLASDCDSPAPRRSIPVSSNLSRRRSSPGLSGPITTPGSAGRIPVPTSRRKKVEKVKKEDNSSGSSVSSSETDLEREEPPLEYPFPQGNGGPAHRPMSARGLFESTFKKYDPGQSGGVSSPCLYYPSSLHPLN